MTRPEVLVDVFGPAGQTSVLALVETGADITILPRSAASRIGVATDDAHRWPVGGLGGQIIEASPGDVELGIAWQGSSIRWKATIAFVDYPAGAEQVSILGHVGFLDFFRVIFDGPAKESEIQPTSGVAGPDA